MYKRARKPEAPIAPVEPVDEGRDATSVANEVIDKAVDTMSTLANAVYTHLVARLSTSVTNHEFAAKLDLKEVAPYVMGDAWTAEHRSHLAALVTAKADDIDMLDISYANGVFTAMILFE